MEPQMNSDEHGWDRTGYSKEPQKPQTEQRGEGRPARVEARNPEPGTRNLNSLSADSAEGRRLGTRKRV